MGTTRHRWSICHGRRFAEETLTSLTSPVLLFGRCRLLDHARMSREEEYALMYVLYLVSLIYPRMTFRGNVPRKGRDLICAA